MVTVANEGSKKIYAVLPPDFINFLWLAYEQHLLDIIKATASVLNLCLYVIKKHGQECFFCSTREISSTQLPIKTIVTAVGKSDPALDLQTGIIFDGNGSY